MKTTMWKDSQRVVESRLQSESPFHGRLIHLFVDQVKLPDGTESGREWIKHPGACAVVPIFRDGTTMLVRQYRYPVRQVFWEVPAGKIDPGEPEEETARRETEEETGLKASSLAYVGHFYPVIGYSDEVIHIYAAWDLEEYDRNLDEDEFLIKDRVPFSEALQMIQQGHITDGKTICSLYRTRDWWGTHKPFDLNL